MSANVLKSIRVAQMFDSSVTSQMKGTEFLTLAPVSQLIVSKTRTNCDWFNVLSRLDASYMHLL